MKVTLQQIQEGNEEAVIRYRQMTERIEDIVRYVEGQSEKLLVLKDGQQILLNLPDIIYVESVDGTTFLYTGNDVYRTNLTLFHFETLYADHGFFRCSKSMILNIYRIRRLKSMSASRIDAALDNEEHIVISRHYAKQLRNILKGEM
ncbi:MAG: LytTR family transcriptional regulator DNA-binding domain-containing protein [Ruminococcus sp.]|nr:LytTR family transcriptional regulator DNA-binding domain-containing protein [Ruminococcus sp.]